MNVKFYPPQAKSANDVVKAFFEAKAGLIQNCRGEAEAAKQPAAVVKPRQA